MVQQFKLDLTVPALLKLLVQLPSGTEGYGILPIDFQSFCSDDTKFSLHFCEKNQLIKISKDVERNNYRIYLTQISYTFLEYLKQTDVIIVQACYAVSTITHLTKAQLPEESATKVLLSYYYSGEDYWEIDVKMKVFDNTEAAKKFLLEKYRGGKPAVLPLHGRMVTLQCQ